MPLHIFNIVEFRSKWIGHVHDDDFPIRFAFIEESHDTEYFDLFDLTYVADLFADLADVERVVVAFGFSLDMRLGGVFPCLCNACVWVGVNYSGSGLSTYLRESTIVPYVTMMRETVPDITQTTFLDILSDRVERLFFRNFELSIGPTRNFNDHVENPTRLISEKGNIVPGGNNRSVLLDENTMF